MGIMRKALAGISAWVRLRFLLIAAVLAAGQLHGVALGEDPGVERRSTSSSRQAAGTGRRPYNGITVTTEALGMSGWQPDPTITIDTGALGLTGWRRDSVAITTQALGMTGWQHDPIAITTPKLGLTGSQREPIVITTRAFGLTGWAALPEQCSAPFVRDSAGAECVCPPDLLPSGEGCIAAEAGPPPDLRVESDGPDVCEAGETCRFDVLVVNVGAGPFRGPLAVRQEVDPSGAEVSAAGSGWSCAANTCVRPGLALAPGGNDRLTVELLLPETAGQGSRLRHCAELKAPDPGDGPVRFVQLLLTAAGIDVGPIDNVAGRKTSDGIRIFRRSVGLPNDSDIDAALIAALRGSILADPHPENDRDCAEARVTRSTL